MAQRRYDPSVAWIEDKEAVKPGTPQVVKDTGATAVRTSGGLLTPTAIRLGAGFGSLAGPLVGAGASAAGEILAQKIEAPDKPINWPRVGVETAIGAVPMGKAFKAGKALKAAGYGTALAGAGVVGRKATDTEEGSLSKWGTGDLIQLALGGALGAGASKIGPRKLDLSKPEEKFEHEVGQALGVGVDETPRLQPKGLRVGTTPDNKPIYDLNKPKATIRTEEPEVPAVSEAKHRAVAATTKPSSIPADVDRSIEAASDVGKAQRTVSDKGDKSFVKRIVEKEKAASIADKLKTKEGQDMIKAQTNAFAMKEKETAEAAAGRRVDTIMKGLEQKGTVGRKVSAKDRKGVKTTVTETFGPKKADEAAGESGNITARSAIPTKPAVVVPPKPGIFQFVIGSTGEVVGTAATEAEAIAGIGKLGPGYRVVPPEGYVVQKPGAAPVATPIGEVPPPKATKSRTPKAKKGEAPPPAAAAPPVLPPTEPPVVPGKGGVALQEPGGVEVSDATLAAMAAEKAKLEEQAATLAAAPAAAPPTGVPFMVTKAHMAELRKLGYTPAQYNKMAPEDVQAILASRTPATFTPPAAPEAPTAPPVAPEAPVAPELPAAPTEPPVAPAAPPAAAPGKPGRPGLPPELEAEKKAFEALRANSLTNPNVDPALLEQLKLQGKSLQKRIAAFYASLKGPMPERPPSAPSAGVRLGAKPPAAAPEVPAAAPEVAPAGEVPPVEAAAPAGPPPVSTKAPSEPLPPGTQQLAELQKRIADNEDYIRQIDADPEMDDITKEMFRREALAKNTQLKQELLQADPNMTSAPSIEELMQRAKGEKGAIDPELAQLMLMRGAPTIGGALIGGAYDDESPLRGALIGGALGLGAGMGATALAQHPDIIDTAKDRLTHIGRSLPNFQRFNLLTEPKGLGINSALAPWGAGVMGSLERIGTGLVERGMGENPSYALSEGVGGLKQLANPSYVKRAGPAWQQAKEMLEGVNERGEMLLGEAQTPADKVMSLPSTVMAMGDITARNALMEGGLSEDAARAITLTANPRTLAGEKFVEIAKSHPTLAFMMPFSRTAVNAVESGMERVPILHSLYNSMLLDPQDKASFAQTVSMYGMSAGVAKIAYEIGQNVDPDTAKQWQIPKIVSNMAGQYGSIAAAAYAAGAANRVGKDPYNAAASSSVREIPLPATTQVLDIARSIGNYSKEGSAHPTATGVFQKYLPNFMVPGMLRDANLTPVTEALQRYNRELAWQE